MLRRAVSLLPCRWDQFQPTCDPDHSEKWAEKISYEVTKLMMEDKEAMKAKNRSN
jgi:hypothetical protein